MVTENLPNIKVLALLLEPNLNKIFLHVLCRENTLEELRKVIGCCCVACTEIELAGKVFDVWSDDEALLKVNPVPTLYISDEFILFGNLVMAKHDEKGETIGLTLADIHFLQIFVQKQFQKLQKYFGR